MSILVVSLDFEMFWGVTDSRSLASYGKNVEGVWEAIPRVLSLFKAYGIKATWATVGMLICKDYNEWMERRPSLLPSYNNPRLSNYNWSQLSRDNPKLFFGRPLVEMILETPGQEFATHTYSHFFCGESGVTPEQFAADLRCAQDQVKELGGMFESLVFPRNQAREAFLRVLPECGIRTFRGNPDSWLYRDGHHIPGGVIGRAFRMGDSWFPLSGNLVSRPDQSQALINIPASIFLRPWARRFAGLDLLRISRMKAIMKEAAEKEGVCHIWWHPHNFGVETEKNLDVLRELLEHFRHLQDRYGMRSLAMADFTKDTL